MTHDPFCYYSLPDNADLWDVPEPCEDCRRLSFAREDEREKAAKRVNSLFHSHQIETAECDWCDALRTANAAILGKYE